MDIQISSNFERFLYHASGDDSAVMRGLMANLETNGALQPSPDLLKASQAVMSSARVHDEEVLQTIADVHAESGGYTLDPHSAIGVAAAKQLGGSSAGVPMICLACAHWAKFPDAVGRALGAETFAKLTTPEEFVSLPMLPTRVAPLPNSVTAVKTFIEQKVAQNSS